MIDVEQWAEIRRLHFVVGLSIKEICRRTGRNRSTVRRAVRADAPPRYERVPAASKLEPHKPEIHRLLGAEPRMPATRIRELIAEGGYDGGQTILDVYLRELRPLFAPAPRTFQRTLYRPGEICQFDLWQPSTPIPVGHGQERRGWVVVACLGYSRCGAGALIFSKRANRRIHRALRCRPVDRLGEELGAMRPLPAEVPDLDPRIVLRVPPDPHVRVDTCDYSLDPRLVGRRVEVRVGQREISAMVLDTGELAAQHRRSYARHRTITDLAHARALREGRAPAEPEVEERPLARYDALIPA